MSRLFSGISFTWFITVFGTIVHRIYVHIVAYTLDLAFEFQHWNTLNISLQIQVLYNKNLSQIYNNLYVNAIQGSVICPLFSFYIQSFRN